MIDIVIMLVAENILLKEVTANQKTLSTRLQLYMNMRQGFKSICAQLSSDIPTIKSL